MGKETNNARFCKMPDETILIEIGSKNLNLFELKRLVRLRALALLKNKATNNSQANLKLKEIFSKRCIASFFEVLEFIIKIEEAELEKLTDKNAQEKKNVFIAKLKTIAGAFQQFKPTNDRQASQADGSDALVYENMCKMDILAPESKNLLVCLLPAFIKCRVVTDPELATDALFHLLKFAPEAAQALLKAEENYNNAALLKLLLKAGLTVKSAGLSWSIAESEDIELIKIFLATKPDYNSMVGERVIVRHGWDDDFPGDYEVYKTCNNWSAIAEAALYNKLEAVKLFAEQYPEAVPTALAALDKVRKLSMEYAEPKILREKCHNCEYYDETKCYIQPAEVQAARVKLLLQLNHRDHKDYVISYADKRLLQDYLLGCIGQLTSIQVALAFYNQYKDAFFATQQRHACFDKFKQTFFGRAEVHYPEIKKQFIAALQAKAVEFIAAQENKADRRINAQLLSAQDLFKNQHQKMGVTVEWHDKLQEHATAGISLQRVSYANCQ